MDKIQYISKEGSSIIVPVFNGRAVDRMPELISQGYNPISIAEIMEQKIKAWQSKNQELAQLWLKNYFDSGDGIMYHPDGRIKIVYDSQTLRNINPNTQLMWNGAPVLPDSTFSNTQLMKKGAQILQDETFSNTQLMWNGAQVLREGTFDYTIGVEFSRRNVKKYANKYLKLKDVLKNPMWLALARGDKELLKEYVGQVYSRINDPNLMKIWISDAPDFEAERLWSFIGLDYSHVCGNDSGQLTNDYGHLIGIPKVQISDKITPIETKINLEALINDFKILNDEKILTPKVQALYKDLKIGKYNL